MKLTALAILAVFVCQAQSFEVASIKPTSPDLQGMQLTWTPNNTRVTIKGLTLKDLIRFSYAEGGGILASNLVSGGPSWCDRDRYDIDAKAEGPKLPSSKERWLLVRTLLASRFNLKFHRESKMAPVFALVVAKNGPKMKESTPDSANQRTMGPTGLTGRNIAMAEIAMMLQDLLGLDPQNSMGLPVIDQTGLTAKFDFELKLQLIRHVGQANDDAGESLFTALREQLGLELKSTKASVDVIVVDSAEKPAEN